MPGLAGTATPWAEWETDEAACRYWRPGHRVGDLELLVEALRADGVAENLRDAYQMLDTVRCTHGYYGYLAGETDPCECDAAGETNDGDYVEVTLPCIYASLGAP